MLGKHVIIQWNSVASFRPTRQRGPLACYSIKNPSLTRRAIRTWPSALKSSLLFTVTAGG